GPGTVPHRLSQAGTSEIRDGLAEMPHTGHQHAVGGPHRVRIRREGRLVPAGSQRPHHASQVVDPVIHHRDHNTPLVDGTPRTRGSSAGASSSARANALNVASTM